MKIVPIRVARSVYYANRPIGRYTGIKYANRPKGIDLSLSVEESVRNKLKDCYKKIKKR